MADGRVPNVNDMVGEPAPHLPVAEGWWVPALSSEERRAFDERRRGRAGEPDWVVLIGEAVASAPAYGRPVPPTPAPGRERDLVGPLLPLVEAAGRRFMERVGDLPANARVDRDAVWSWVRDWLVGRLTAIAGRTLVRELRVTGAAGKLHGADGRARFLDYLRRLTGRAALTRLLHDYPVLARLLAERCLRTADAAAELVARFADDRALLVAELLADQDPGALVRVDFGKGDLHDGGRSVAVLTFADRAQLVYKPRPLGLHARWNELLAWFGDIRPDLAVRAVRLVPRTGYGWAEFIPARPCVSAAEVELFYRRQGGLLALLYALDATDIHFENVVACGDQPVVVDMETLFHPDWLPVTDGGHDPALDAMNRSVMRIALLPKMFLGENGSLDVSGLGGGAVGALPTELVAWVDAGTDSMRLVRRPIILTAGTNRPVLFGVAADPLVHQDRLLGGFRVGYEAIVEHAAELLAEDGPLAGFAAEQLRLVMRNTQVYAALLDAATRPGLMADGAGREAAFAELSAANGHAHLMDLAPFEVRALFSGDVPLFTASVGGRDVVAGAGDVLPRLLHASGIETATAKIRRMGATDLREQEWLVQATLATKAPSSGHRAVDVVPGPVASVVPDQQRLLALASGIGDDLIARSWQDSERANWLGLELVDGRHWSVLPMGAGLAEGYCGTALFLAQLGLLTGTSRYLELAGSAVCRLSKLVAILADHPELARRVGAGGFFGIGGICYAIARLGNLLRDTSLIGLLPDALRAVSHADSPGRVNIADGTAGALVAVSAVYAETGLPDAAALQVELADRLRAQTFSAAPGFLWGRTGIDWALGQAGPPCDLSAYSTRDAGADDDLGWCSGRAGEMLAGFADRLPAADDDATAASLRGFGDRLDTRPSRADLSLCHGQLGRVEPLIELAGRGYTPAGQALTRVAAQILGVLEQYGAGCGTPKAVTTPGLLFGLAGIGFGLLRLGFGGQVPSVLLLQPAHPVETGAITSDHAGSTHNKRDK